VFPWLYMMVVIFGQIRTDVAHLKSVAHLT
jgi:hypothetical protein